MKLAIITGHAGAATLGQATDSWGYAPIFVMPGHDGPLVAWQRGLERTKEYDVIAVLHDDLILHDLEWADKVLHEFEDPKVGLVGFGGSKVWGDRGIYRKPYQIMQLSRGLYLSNMTDAEVHGARYTGPPTDVSVLDGFALIYRRELLIRAGGFPVKDLKFHGYDFWAAAMCWKLGYKIRLVPISCTHLGGQTSVIQHMDDGTSHAKGHEYIYEFCRGLLPVSVE
jgi:hypothetical protein